MAFLSQQRSRQMSALLTVSALDRDPLRRQDPQELYAPVVRVCARERSECMRGAYVSVCEARVCEAPSNSALVQFATDVANDEREIGQHSLPPCHHQHGPPCVGGP